MTTLKDAKRLRASVVRLSYDSRTNSYGSRATIARHLQHLSDICPSPKSLFILYVVRMAAVRIRTAAVWSQKIASRSQEKWACRNPPCDVAIDRTALRICTTALRSLANSLRFESLAIARLSYGWCKQGFRLTPNLFIMTINYKTLNHFKADIN